MNLEPDWALRVREMQIAPLRGTVMHIVAALCIALQVATKRIRVVSGVPGCVWVEINWPWWRMIWPGWRARRQRAIDTAHSVLRDEMPLAIVYDLEVV